jgi:hypothetical protein
MKHKIPFYAAILLLLCTALSNADAQTTPDPGLNGPYAVTKAEYNLGDLVATLDSFPSPVEVRGSVHYPTGLAGGPYPVILLLHGRHSTCYNTTSLSTSSTWPCPSTSQPIVSYQGYDYHARQMASWGYIVISISCNAINAGDAALSNSGMPARGQLVQHHLNLWNTFTTTGGAPFGTLFVGKLDMQNIGTMGHSRGGEGVVFNALLNRSLGSPYGIKAVLTLAPVDFKRKILNGIPLMNIAPYCDGDVSNLQGVHFYDDSRYSDTTDEAAKHNVVMMGANHNYFNTVWTPGSYIAGGSDDWLYTGTNTSAYCGPSSATSKRFDTIKQKAAYLSYAAAFFRTYVGKETQFMPILTAEDIVPPVTSMLDTTNVFVSYHPGRTDRRDINRTDTVYRETVNNIGGAVTTGTLMAFGICGGGLSMSSCAVGTTTQEPHRGTTTVKGLGQQGIRWNDTADWYQNDIPAARQDLTYVRNLQFRAALKYNECTAGQSLDFTVQLIDSAGNKSNQVVADHSKALYYEPGTLSSVLPHVLFNTISMPVSSFTGINLKKVRKVKFLFNKSAAGSILISDLAFANEYCGAIDGKFGFTFSAGKKVNFTDTMTTNTGDTLSWSWNFGEPSSGAANTSTLHNPNHVYSTTGTFTACLYVSVKRQNGRVCTDTFCKTINVAKAAVPQPLVVENLITIYPNPANDYIFIGGAEKTDVLKLVDMFGKVVLTATLSDPTVNLPRDLPTGIYNAVVITSKGLVHQKVVISR